MPPPPPAEHAIATAAERRALGRVVEAERVALGYSGAASRAHAAAAREVLRFCHGERGRLTVEQITRADVRAYYRYAGRRPGRRLDRAGVPLTRAALARHLRRGAEVFRVLVRRGELVADPASGVAVGPYLPEAAAPARRLILTRAEVGALYAAADALAPERWPRRARALLALVYGCGLRAAEAQALTLGEVKLSEGLVIVARGKGGKRRVVPMSAGVVRDVEGYLSGERGAILAGAYGKYGANARAAVLVNERGSPMRGKAQNRVLVTLAEAAGLRDAWGDVLPVRCHCLRRAVATHLLEAGLTTEQLRVMLGHASLDTTQVYLGVGDEQVGAVGVGAVGGQRLAR